MIKIGQFNSLRIGAQQGAAIYLGDKTSRKIPLLEKQLPSGYQAGDEMNVFVFVDQCGHLAATCQRPLAEVDQIAWLQLKSTNYVGAFFDWGWSKDLLVPFSEQHHEMEIGRYYLVRLFLDQKDRVVATTKIERWLSDQSTDFVVGQQVSLIIAGKSDLGIKAIINHSHWGLLYENELFQPVKKGQKINGYIKHIRDDSRIDLSLQVPGYRKVTALTEIILEKLKANNGVLMISDKTAPEVIYHTFGVSKKVYKQAIGALYKQQLISIDKEHGIRLRS